MEHGAAVFKDRAFVLTVSADEDLVAAASAVAGRIGEVAGCANDHAARLGQAVGLVLNGLAAAARAAGRPRVFEASFTCTGRLVRVDVSVSAADTPPSFSLEGVLAACGCADSVAKLVDRVEFDRDDDRHHCRLTRQIPQAR